MKLYIHKVVKTQSCEIEKCNCIMTEVWKYAFISSNYSGWGKNLISKNVIIQNCKNTKLWEYIIVRKKEKKMWNDSSKKMWINLFFKRVLGWEQLDRPTNLKVSARAAFCNLAMEVGVMKQVPIWCENS